MRVAFRQKKRVEGEGGGDEGHKLKGGGSFFLFKGSAHFSVGGLAKKKKKNLLFPSASSFPTNIASD